MYVHILLLFLLGKDEDVYVLNIVKGKKMNCVFEGVATALVTPFKDGKVNYEKIDELVDAQIRNGVQAIVSCGSTGEASTLDDNEHISVIEHTVKRAAGKVKVIAGTGSNYTMHGVELSRRAEDVGADAILSVTPYYNKTTQQGLIDHYSRIADSIDIPIILYNIPSRTGMNINPSTLLELSKVKNIVGLKECNFGQIIETRRLCGDALSIYTGDDINIVPALSLGCKGVISTMSNIIPKETLQIYDTFKAGVNEEAAELQIYYAELINALFCEVNPIPLKEAMNYLGYEVGECRLPLTSMSKENKELLKTTLAMYKIRKN